MRNVIIGTIIALVIAGGLWYFVGQRIEQPARGPEMDMGGKPRMDNSSVSSEEIVNCPVMGTRINPSRAYGKAEYKGKTYYFCCAMCPGEFKKNPDKYVK